MSAFEDRLQELLAEERKRVDEAVAFVQRAADAWVEAFRVQAEKMIKDPKTQYAFMPTPIDPVTSAALEASGTLPPATFEEAPPELHPEVAKRLRDAGQSIEEAMKPSIPAVPPSAMELVNAMAGRRDVDHGAVSENMRVR